MGMVGYIRALLPLVLPVIPRRVHIVMTDVSILQPEDDTASPSITLPDSFVALKGTDTGSVLFLGVLQQFLDDEKRNVLKKLGGLAATEVANFLDEVHKPNLTTDPNRGQPTFP